MGFVWVASLTCILIVTKLGATEVSQSCFTQCPPGYKVDGKCDDPAAPNRCTTCGPDTYTEVNNTVSTCFRCSSCARHEMVIKSCVAYRDTKCDCKEGYYYKNEVCYPCSSFSGDLSESSTDYRRKCLTCQSKHCMNDPQCKKKCSLVPSITPPTTPTSSLTTVTKESPRKTSPNGTSNPAVQPVPKNSNSLKVWLFTFVVFLLLFWFLLLFYRNLFRNQGPCSCWSSNKDLERPAQEADLNERHSHHSSRSTALALSISEETPMMSSCHEPPVNICDQMAAIHEQSERWPAIVLYAIIKEVPLRRWKEFLRLLSVPDQQMERVELEAGLGSIEKQYQMLRLWSQRSSASLSEVYTSLHNMDLLGCAQLLQENLEKMQQGPEPVQGLAA